MTLKSLIKKHGFDTAKAFCEYSKIAPSVICRLINGKVAPQFQTLQRLKAVLGEEVEQCFIHQDEPVALVDLEAC